MKLGNTEDRISQLHKMLSELLQIFVEMSYGCDGGKPIVHKTHLICCISCNLPHLISAVIVTFTMLQMSSCRPLLRLEYALLIYFSESSLWRWNIFRYFPQYLFLSSAKIPYECQKIHENPHSILFLHIYSISHNCS